MTARIAPAKAPFPQKLQDWFDRITPAGRAPLTLFTTIARDERLAERFFSGGLLDRGNLTLRQREIVIDRTTALCRSEYEWGVHVGFFATRVGLTGEQRHSLVHGSAQDACWSTAESLLIRLCDELHTRSSVSDELWAALRKEHTEQAMLELLMLAGSYHMVSYLTNGLKLPLEPDGASFPPGPVPATGSGNHPRPTSVSPILPVADMDAAIRFYEEVLGFRTAWKRGTPPTIAGVCSGEVEIMLARRSAGEGAGTASVYVQLRHVSQYYAEITAAGATVVHPLAQREYGMKDCRILDPDGNELSFGEPSSI